MFLHLLYNGGLKVNMRGWPLKKIMYTKFEFVKNENIYKKIRNNSRRLQNITNIWRQINYLQKWKCV